MIFGRVLGRTQNSKALRRDRGLVLVAAMLMLAGLMSAAILATQRTSNTAHVVRRDYQDERVFHVADGGADVAERWLRNLLRVNPDPSPAQLGDLPAPGLRGYDFAELSVTKEERRPDVLIQHGPFEGMYADVQPYTIRSHAENHNATNHKTVEVTLAQYWVNLFQYAIYYDGDLEISMRNPSTYTGRIHSNSNVYLTAQSNFDIYGSVSAAGHIFNTPLDPSIPFAAGKCRIADRAGRLRFLDYDWRDPDWVEQSLEDWDGLVRDSSHGSRVMPSPILTLPDPIDLINRGQAGDDSLHRSLRFYYRAGLRIINDVATDIMGNPVDITGLISAPDGVMDHREGQQMQMRTLRIDSLMARGLVPANGIIYISYDKSGDPAVRIAGGRQLPAGGLVIASDNPVYVQGNYNTVNKQPSSFFCDAFNLYSNAWLDTRSHSNLNQRNASPTHVNTCIVTGDVPTAPGRYSGGANNLIRLHERWLAHSELKYRGSMVCIWSSEQATGPFVYGAPVFTEQHRDQAYDPDLADPAFWPDRALVESNMARSSWRSR